MRPRTIEGDTLRELHPLRAWSVPSSSGTPHQWFANVTIYASDGCVVAALKVVAPKNLPTLSGDPSPPPRPPRVPSDRSRSNHKVGQRFCVLFLEMYRRLGYYLRYSGLKVKGGRIRGEWPPRGRMNGNFIEYVFSWYQVDWAYRIAREVKAKELIEYFDLTGEVDSPKDDDDELPVVILPTKRRRRWLRDG